MKGWPVCRQGRTLVIGRCGIEVIVLPTRRAVGTVSYVAHGLVTTSYARLFEYGNDPDWARQESEPIQSA
jgi:hypothetical protein